MKGTFCAFLDASVLYPVSLRNLLMRLTLNGLFQARWSAQVHEEWIRAVLRDRPVNWPKTRTQMLDRRLSCCALAGTMPTLSGRFDDIKKQ
jgi:hypothetical protein